MIFVMVGTHEQPFDRLIDAMDTYALDTKETIIIQGGYYAGYVNNCVFYDFLDYSEMLEYVEKADAVVSHGGPGCIMMALENDKSVVAVPRLKKFNEHVNNHQLEFCKFISNNNAKVLCVEDIEELSDAISLSKKRNKFSKENDIVARRASFIENLSGTIEELMKGDNKYER